MDSIHAIINPLDHHSESGTLILLVEQNASRVSPELEIPWLNKPLKIEVCRDG
jgi:hypothetical protein